MNYDEVLAAALKLSNYDKLNLANNLIQIVRSQAEEVNPDKRDFLTATAPSDPSG